MTVLHSARLIKDKVWLIELLYEISFQATTLQLITYWVKLRLALGFASSLKDAKIQVIDTKSDKNDTIFIYTLNFTKIARLYFPNWTST